MSLRSRKIATRAGLGFAVLALLVALVGASSLLQMKRMNGAAEVKEVWLPSIVALNDMGQNILRIRTLPCVDVIASRSTLKNTAQPTSWKGDLRQAQHATSR